MKKIPYRRAIGMQADVLEATRPELVRAAAQLRERLPEQGVVGILGIGASFYSALSAVREFWKLGVRAVAVDVGQLWQDDLDVADVYLVISASGESLETVEAVKRIKAHDDRLVVAITAEGIGSLTGVADMSVTCGQLEDSVPATTSYTGSLQALALLASAWEPAAATERLAQAWAGVPARLSTLLAEADEAVAEVASRLAATAAIDFVGAPDASGSAAEGALLYREAPRLATTWFESRAYLHGPMESLQGDRGLVVIGDTTDDAVARILDQAGEIGGPTVHISAVDASAVTGTLVPVPGSDARLVRAAYEMAVLQVLSARSAEVLDLTSGRFRYPQPQVKLKQASF